MVDKRWAAAAGLSAIMVTAAACGSSGNGSSGSSTGASSSSSAGSTSAASINLGVYCASTCRQQLALHTSPSSVKCKVAFLDDATSFPYGATQYQEAQKYARKYFPGMSLTVQNGNNDPVAQSQQLNTVVAQGYKVVILDPVVSDALVPATKKAEAAGVKIVDIDRTVNTPVQTIIKAPDVPLGAREAQYVASQLHGHGTVAILSGTPGASPTIDRTQGIMSVLKHYPGIHVVSNVNGNYDTNQSYTAVTNLLTRYPKGQLNWIISEADVMSLGAIKALQGAHRTDVKLASIDGQNQGLQAVQAGQMQADVVYPVVQPAAEVAAAKVCAGESVASQVALLYPLVTKANVSTYLGTNFG
ncbi:MAG: substrate-binding domain-containing protein [Streptosporangiaceae bacterium]